MTAKYRLAVLMVVVVAVVLIIFSGDLFLAQTSPEEEKDPAEAGTDDLHEPQAVAVMEFRTTEDPFMAFVSARRQKQPIVLEFYARW